MLWRAHLSSVSPPVGVFEAAAAAEWSTSAVASVAVAAAVAGTVVAVAARIHCRRASGGATTPAAN